jgi:serine/threonine protein kinase
VQVLSLLETQSAGPERCQGDSNRFDREAQALAALNHPHIAQVHGFAHEGDVRAIVMELVEGPTLAERIARAPLPPDEALPLAIQLADALEYAHEHGIIHRDLKPANIKLTADGAVKVLDFGLAKVLAGDAPGPGPDPLGTSRTMMSPARLRQGFGGAHTEVGVILGTAAYMAPEQARGAAVDKRADIWAFGVVLFEMLTGRACFTGETVTDVLAAVVKTEPDWSALPPGTPPRLRDLLRRCLAFDGPSSCLTEGWQSLDVKAARTFSRYPRDMSSTGPVATSATCGCRVMDSVGPSLISVDVRTGQQLPWRKKFEVADPAGITYWNVVITRDARFYAYSYIRGLDELYVVDGLK